MADLKISELSSATPTSAALLAAVVNSTTVKVTAQSIVNVGLATSTGIAASGSMWYANSSGQISSLAIGTSGYVLQSTGTIPAWVTPKKYVAIEAFSSAIPLASGPVGYLHIPPDLDGYNLSYVQGTHYSSAASAGRTDFKIHNVTDNSSMLTSGYNIDSGIINSTASASQGLIDTTMDDVAAGDLLRIDVTAVPSASAPKGLLITLGFQLP